MHRAVGPAAGYHSKFNTIPHDGRLEGEREGGKFHLLCVKGDAYY